MKYKFRGKRVDTKEWIYGYVVGGGAYNDFCFITDSNVFTGYKVIPETVGMLTGLQDMSDKDIYEGDILQTNNATGETLNTTVIWSKQKACYMVDKTYCGIQRNLCKWNYCSSIIGNKHDNPELIGGAK